MNEETTTESALEPVTIPESSLENTPPPDQMVQDAGVLTAFAIVAGIFFVILFIVIIYLRIRR